MAGHRERAPGEIEALSSVLRSLGEAQSIVAGLLSQRVGEEMADRLPPDIPAAGAERRRALARERTRRYRARLKAEGAQS